MSEVLVGRRPLASYVLACYLALQQGRSVTLRARGRAISRAVDAVQALRGLLVREAEVRSVELGTELVRGPDGREVPVSTISITVALPQRGKRVRRSASSARRRSS
ncbi:MAG: RNA-binding protein [Nitrososphaerota archaeon]